ncbi:peptidoglycan-binding protein [Patescibacteria group bacterium]|nr:peptidoglycan-binding protein [Patescibacteria group bacterium]
MHLLIQFISGLLSIVFLVPTAYAEGVPLASEWKGVTESSISPGTQGAVPTSVVAEIDMNRTSSAIVQIKGMDGTVVRSESVSGMYLVYEWDGTNQNGEIVSDGVYTFEYHITDGEETLIDTSLSVAVDTRGPSLTLLGENPLHIAYGSVWEDPGATTDGVRVETQGAVHTNQMATSTVTYTAIDAGGNITSAIREVVIDPIPVTVVISNQTHTYDGSPKSVTVNTNPEVDVAILYNGNAELPSEIGNYGVEVSVIEDGYQGTAEGSLAITASAGSGQSTQYTTTIRTEVEKYVVTVPQETGTTTVDSILQQMKRSPLDIEALQKALIQTGHLAIAAPTGVYGPLTQTAVRFYQLSHQLPETGFVDTDTLAAIENELVPDTDTILDQLQEILTSVEKVVAKVIST